MSGLDVFVSCLSTKSIIIHKYLFLIIIKITIHLYNLYIIVYLEYIWFICYGLYNNLIPKDNQKILQQIINYNEQRSNI